MKSQKIINDIKSTSHALHGELTAAYDGNKAAARRARKLTLDLEKLFKEYRKVSCEEARK